MRARPSRQSSKWRRAICVSPGCARATSGTARTRRGRASTARSRTTTGATGRGPCAPRRSNNNSSLQVIRLRSGALRPRLQSPGRAHRATLEHRAVLRPRRDMAGHARAGTLQPGRSRVFLPGHRAGRPMAQSTSRTLTGEPIRSTSRSIKAGSRTDKRRWLNAPTSSSSPTTSGSTTSGRWAIRTSSPRT